MTKGFVRGGAAAAACALVWAFAWQADRRDAEVEIVLECAGDRCAATFDGGDPLELKIPAGRFATRLGAYVYHPWEFDDRAYLRSFRVERLGTGLKDYEPSMRELDAAGWFDGDDGWEVHGGRGLTHTGAPGERSVALFAPPTENDFRLTAELADFVDAGIFFRGYDRENGWLLVVRREYNDAFFVRMHRGDFDAVAAIAPLRELTAGRESLRLAGLVARIGLVCLLALGALQVALLLAGPPPAERRRFLTGARGRRFARVALFGATVAVCGAIAQGWLGAIPHLDDEAAYLFQARVFASGELWAHTPDLPRFFEHEHLIMQGDRWFSKYPPLYSALLALGVLLGAPWLVNALLAALTGLVVDRIVSDLAGPRWGLLAWLLLLASPFFVVMGATLMSHTLACLLTATFTWCLLRGSARRGSGWFLAAGGVLGLAILTRPFTAFLFALAAAPFLLMRLVRTNDRRFRLKMPAAIVAGVLPGLLAFVAWGAVHADPAAPGFNVYAQNNATDTLGFGADKGSTWLQTWGSTGHTPAKALRSAHQYLDYLSTDLYGWPLGISFLFVWVGVVRARRRAAWMAAIPIALAVGHGFYWATQHILYGARYWFSAVPALVVLSVLGLRALAAQARLLRRGHAGLLLGATLVLLVAFNLANYMPHKLRELPRFGNISGDLPRAVDRLDLHGAVVFVKTEGLHFNDGFHLNDPTDPEGNLFARDLGGDNEELIERYPDRTHWRWDGHHLVQLDAHAARRP